MKFRPSEPKLTFDLSKDAETCTEILVAIGNN